jgi:dCTP deaminase
MILTGKEIELQIKQERILISPFDAKNLQPNSYDLHLDITNYKELHGTCASNYNPKEIIPLYYDRSCDITKDDLFGVALMPNILYLFSTIETTHTDHYAPMLEGISSNARMGICVHETAGFGDVGFNGKWTLEISVKVPTPVYHGMRIAQICFHSLIGEIELYKGRYQGQSKVEGAI